jgi:aryl-alcohol dehydrogenase-like predicted oxidoreductase
MEYRQLGRTGLTVSALGFGCGAVGGILVRGSHHEMREVVAAAIASGVTYFDTAPGYGDGESERNLGRVLAELRADVLVGTKVRVVADAPGAIAQAVTQSVDESLRRLRRDQLDLIQLHNALGPQRRPERQWLTVDDAAEAVRTFEDLHRLGKVRYWGINGLGERAAIHQALELGAHTVQACYNLINPTASVPAPPGFPFQDYGQLIAQAAARGIGVLAIRVLAGGALSGSAERHPHAAQAVEPIASGQSFADDVAWARRFDVLVEDGYAGSLAEAAIRFALSTPAVSAALIGISSMEQFTQAAAAANQGPLPGEALERLGLVWQAA